MLFKNHIFHCIQYFGHNAISGILSDTLSLYKSLYKQDKSTDEEEEEKEKEEDYDFIHKLMKVLTLVAKPLEETQLEENKV